ncbi:MAG TPA: hypothetical protein VM754_11000 [Actinomycetota bacterium]|nr:hypothetical protein [Actinomycetota bacterium]
MPDFSRSRQPGEFAAADLGVRAAKAICDRFGAQVTDYSAHGRRSSITLRMPSRRELFHRSIQRSEAVLSEAEMVRRRTADVLMKNEANRRVNSMLRRSVSDVIQTARQTRLESRSIVAGSSQRPTGH